MVNIETRKIVDMIESREQDDVSRWLKEYPNLQVVSRDGSQAYAAAITQAHPSAMQVSDRFHILKNLYERATLVFQKLFQGRIAIPLTAETQDIRYQILIGTKAENIQLVKKLRREGRSKGEIGLLTGLSAPMVKKYICISECDIPKEKPTVREVEHEDAIRKLTQRANRVKALRDEGFSLTEITRKTGFTLAVVKNYLSSDFTPVNAHYGKQREGKLEPFRQDVLQWKTEGLTYREIYGHIKQKGYTGTVDAIRGYISKERRIRRDLQAVMGGEPVEFIDKKWMTRLIYKPIEEVKGISEAQLAAISACYPLAQNILEIVYEFKTLMKDKNLDSLSPWMDKAASLKISEIDTFINGLLQDITAVKNAMTSDYSNGLAEGTINKIKVIKRIMYGRCRFDLLKNKCLLFDNIT